MSSEHSGMYVRHVDTPGGGYRVIESSRRGSKIVKVSYVDKNGFERKELTEWRKNPWWRRVVGAIADFFRWVTGRL